MTGAETHQSGAMSRRGGNRGAPRGPDRSDRSQGGSDFSRDRDNDGGGRKRRQASRSPSQERRRGGDRDRDRDRHRDRDRDRDRDNRKRSRSRDRDRNRGDRDRDRYGRRDDGRKESVDRHDRDRDRDRDRDQDRDRDRGSSRADDSSRDRPEKRGRFSDKSASPAGGRDGAVPEAAKYESRFNKGVFATELKGISKLVKGIEAKSSASAIADPALVISKDACGDELFEELFNLRHPKLLQLKKEGKGVIDDAVIDVGGVAGVGGESKRVVIKEEGCNAADETTMDVDKSEVMDKSEVKNKGGKPSGAEDSAAAEETADDGADDLYGDLGGGEGDLYGDLNTSMGVDDSMVQENQADTEEDEEQARSVQSSPSKDQNGGEAGAGGNGADGDAHADGSAPAGDASGEIAGGKESVTAFLPLENVPYASQNPSTARLVQVSNALMGRGASSHYLSRLDDLKALMNTAAAT